jgi:hypothetical protein
MNMFARTAHAFEEKKGQALAVLRKASRRAWASKAFLITVSALPSLKFEGAGNLVTQMGLARENVLKLWFYVTRSWQLVDR